MLLIFFLVSQVLGMPALNMQREELGTFWQVSDIHLDRNYSVNGLKTTNCHTAEESKNGTKLGKFGDRSCDSPFLLATSAVEAMKRFKADPDFILWTGDNNPHVPDSELDIEKMFTTVHNVTHLLRNTFPGTPLYPSIGNHDSYPSNEIAAVESYYKGFLENASWSSLIPDAGHSTFLKGGYYVSEVQPGLQLITLNTNMYFTLDKSTASESDPGGQLQWFEDTLSAFRKSQHKAYVVGHVPPGVSPDLWKWMYPDKNSRLTNIMRKYHDVIIAGIFAHEHTDNFRLIYDENGISVVPLLMGPAVTPWNEKNNPSMRLYTYNKQTGRLLDYEEYYMDLSAANTGGVANWWTLYQARQSYGLVDLSASSMQTLQNSLGKSPESWSFKNYLQHYSTGYTVGKSCNNSCWQQHICSIRHVDLDAFDKCHQATSLTASLDVGDDQPAQDNSTSQHMMPVCPSWKPLCNKHHPHHNPHPRPVPAYMYPVIYGLAALVFVLFFVVTTLCCCWPRRPVIFLTQPRLAFVKSWEYEPIS